MFSVESKKIALNNSKLSYSIRYIKLNSIISKDIKSGANYSYLDSLGQMISFNYSNLKEENATGSCETHQLQVKECTGLIDIKYLQLGGNHPG